MHPMLNIAVRAARVAGNVIVRGFERLEEVSFKQKSNKDFVSDVDKRAEYEIIQVIKKAYPTHGILAEESGEQKGNEYLWIIDPLDGTNNFMHGYPHFAVSIALLHQGQLDQAVIYDPIRQDLFTASKGAGATLNDTRIRVNPKKTIKNSFLSVELPFWKPNVKESVSKFYQELSEPVHAFRRGGSAALDLAYVACSRLDGYLEPNLKPWDVAAGALIIKEAGGMIGDFKGKGDYLKSGNVIAGCPRVYQTLLETVEKYPV